jgi:hypothetical protein
MGTFPRGGMFSSGTAEASDTSLSSPSRSYAKNPKQRWFVAGGWSKQVVNGQPWSPDGDIAQHSLSSGSC